MGFEKSDFCRTAAPNTKQSAAPGGVRKTIDCRSLMTQDVDEMAWVQCQSEMVETSMDSESEEVTGPDSPGHGHRLKPWTVLQPRADHRIGRVTRCVGIADRHIEPFWKCSDLGQQYVG